jgi:hypothetical protein
VQVQLRVVFNKIDVDGSGDISLTELTQLLPKMHITDRNKQQLTGVLLKQALNQAFENADLNGDGAIDFDEFCTIMTDDLNVHAVVWRSLTGNILSTIKAEQDYIFGSLRRVADSFHEDGALDLRLIDKGKDDAAVQDYTPASYLCIILFIPLIDELFFLVLHVLHEYIKWEDFANVMRIYGQYGWDNTKYKLFAAAKPLWAEVSISILVLLILSCFIALLASRGQTFATFVLGLTVVDDDGEPASWSAMALRKTFFPSDMQWTLRAIVPLVALSLHQVPGVFPGVTAFSCSGDTQMVELVGVSQYLLRAVFLLDFAYRFTNETHQTWADQFTKMRMVYTKSIHAEVKNVARTRGVPCAAFATAFIMLFMMCTLNEYAHGAVLGGRIDAPLCNQGAEWQVAAKHLCDANVFDKASYREWTKLHHPDKTNNLSREKFVQFAAQLTVLQDHMKSGAYDGDRNNWKALCTS